MDQYIIISDKILSVRADYIRTDIMDVQYTLQYISDTTYAWISAPTYLSSFSSVPRFW